MKPYYHDEQYGITIYHGDCREILAGLEPVDLVLTDPPYQFEHTDGGGIVTKYPLWTDCEFRAMSKFKPSDYIPIILDSLRLKNSVFFASRDSISEYAKLSNGLKFDVHVLWKPNAVPFTNNTFKSDLEYICLIYQEGRPFTKGMPEKRYSKVSQHILGSTLPRLHPVEKPLAIITKYAHILSYEGHTILDPFMGSGTTLVAAKQLGRKAIGIEIEEKYCEIAVRRLQQDVFQWS